MRPSIAVDARQTLLDSLPKHAVGAEVGVWKGGFSRRILRFAKPAALHLIDPWTVSKKPEHTTAWFGTENSPDMEAVYNDVRALFAAEISAGVVKIHRGFSGDVLKTFPEAFFDFVYLDGDHAYEAVKADLYAAYSRVKNGGLICGDDYSLKGWWKDGVVRGVHDFVASHRVRIELVLGNQFMIRKI